MNGQEAAQQQARDAAAFEALDPAIQAIILGYEEVKRRSSTEAQDKQRWQVLCVALSCAVALAGAGILALVLFLTQRTVPIYVQVVQRGDDGTLHPVGMPVDLMTWTPETGIYKEMLSGWVQRVRSRGTDQPKASQEWRWVAMHTCGPAIGFLKVYKEVEKPLDPIAEPFKRKTIEVEVKQVVDTKVPTVFQVQWDQRTVVGATPAVTTRHSGLFTVGRLQPKTDEEAIHNRFGVCVKEYNWEK